MSKAEIAAALRLAPLKDYFDAEIAINKKGPYKGRPQAWVLKCKACGARWKLSMGTPPDPVRTPSPGNLLHLLNHARSHS